MNANPGTSWHISTNEIISIKDLVKKIFEIQGVNFEQHVTISNERLGKDYSYLLDSSAIRRDFGWKDKTKLINGIKDTFEWIYSNEGANKEQLLTTYCMMTCKIQNVE